MDALATLADLDLMYGPLADEDRAKAQALLDQASAAVRRYCRQRLSLVTDDVVQLRSDGSATLVLGERPVLDVAAVVMDWRSYSEDRFTWDSAGNLRRLRASWGPRHSAVTVTYTHGYDPVPADLVGLVVAKAAAALAAGRSNPDGLKSTQVGAMSETYSTQAGSAASLGAAGLTEEERAVLDAAGYRWRVGTYALER